ncbi:MAG TPA: DUF3108 domain-containing protein [Myxococcota bacterium]|nr:DUF3108 domain-containing protein [Myxococcota bacterium]
MGLPLWVGLVVLGGPDLQQAAAAAPGAAPEIAALSKGNVLPVWLQAAPSRTDDGKPPRTPDGLPQCSQILRPVGELPRGPGETIRYVVDLDGLSVGTVDFKIERRGVYQGKPVVEYRSLFKIDSLVATFVPVEGRAATLVTEPGYTPSKAMNRYRLNNDEIEEDMTYSADAHGVHAKATKDGKPKEEHRSFATPVQDFVSGFYLLRRLPVLESSCAVIYGNGRAYTVWIQPDGQEEIKTPVGLRVTDRYVIRYGSDKGTKLLSGRIWLGRDTERLPYKAELDGAHHLEARIHLYQAGKAP